MCKLTVVFVSAVVLFIAAVEAVLIYDVVTSPAIVINDADAPNHEID